jgi:hypothetical protein
MLGKNFWKYILRISQRSVAFLDLGCWTSAPFPAFYEDLLMTSMTPHNTQHHLTSDRPYLQNTTAHLCPSFAFLYINDCICSAF